MLWKNASGSISATELVAVAAELASKAATLVGQSGESYGPQNEPARAGVSGTDAGRVR
jgi:hypothetical protein